MTTPPLDFHAHLKFSQLAEAGTDASVQTTGSQVTQASDGEVVIILSGSALVQEPPDSNPRDISANTLLQQYREQGSACIAQLQGLWAVVIIDRSKHRCLFAIDRMGRHPLYYRLTPDGLVLGATLNQPALLPPDPALSEQSLYNYVHFHMIPATRTIYNGVYKLSAGHLAVAGDGELQTRRYWLPTFIESNRRPSQTLEQDLRQALKEAVSRNCDDQANTAAFLSGGLDSSTVAGMLSELQGGSCEAFAIGFDAPGYDEMEYARITARHFGIRLHEYYVTPEDVVSALPDIAANTSEPFGNSSVLPAYFCARMATAKSVDTLLAGDGGDELFAGNERYAKQRAFQAWEHLPGLLRRLFATSVKPFPGTLPLISKVKSYITQANLGLPDRLQYYSFLNINDPADVFSDSFFSRVNAQEPMTLLRDIYHAPGQATDLNKMLYMDWQITLADNDLPKVNQACAMAGVQVRYPMLDDALVAFSTSVPSHQKLPRGQLRQFYKDSLTGWLPEETIHKEKHGFGLPFGVWMREHPPLQDIAYDNIQSLKKRAIFKQTFLDEAIKQHREGHASFYGELIWILTTLELWLHANQPDFCYD